ncbi:glycosyltransferase [Clostridium perfringens]|uniref:glycosyltransferase n=1 Tax=Clostridium perfringens TaxID=1502 RepID=UPI001ABB9F29|nr:glycosyltransferase [Clostridium perfringens]MBO3342221.1 glycosyltransferase [Clostridium perfringens]MDM0524867.1 glycosyltransferase [Clostridium perfringens]
MSILVSINCITYNHEKYIANAIEGFLMQETNFKYEIIIGEDCSTDNTRNIIENYIKEYPGRIKLITSSNNVGARRNSRRVFKESKGKYIAICEGDDYWTDKHKLQKQVDYMEKNEQCNLVFHNVGYLNNSTKKIKYNQILEEKKYYLEDIVLNSGGFIPTASILYRKELMENPPEWYMKASVGDYPLQILSGLNGYVYCISDIMALYRINVEGSWSSNQLKNLNKEKLLNKEINVIKILNDFNKYTDSKYIDLVNKAKIQYEYRVDLLNKNMKLKDIKRSKYNEYYENLSKKEKFESFLALESTCLYIFYLKSEFYFKRSIKKVIGNLKNGFFKE